MTDTGQTKDVEHAVGLLPWAQLLDDMLDARESRRVAVLGAVRTFVNRSPFIARFPCRKAAIEARLDLRENLVSARFQFRRAVVRSASHFASTA